MARRQPKYRVLANARLRRRARKKIREFEAHPSAGRRQESGKYVEVCLSCLLLEKEPRRRAQLIREVHRVGEQLKLTGQGEPTLWEAAIGPAIYELVELSLIWPSELSHELFLRPLQVVSSSLGLVPVRKLDFVDRLGIDSGTRGILRRAGYISRDDFERAAIAEMEAVPGIGEKRLKIIVVALESGGILLAD